MPKIRPLTSAERDRVRVSENLKTIQGGHRKTDEEMSKILGCSKPTYRNRIKNPDNMTAKEIRNICLKFNISAENLVNGVVKVV